MPALQVSDLRACKDRLIVLGKPSYWWLLWVTQEHFVPSVSSAPGAGGPPAELPVRMVDQCRVHLRLVRPCGRHAPGAVAPLPPARRAAAVRGRGRRVCRAGAGAIERVYVKTPAAWLVRAAPVSACAKQHFICNKKAPVATVSVLLQMDSCLWLAG